MDRLGMRTSVVLHKFAKVPWLNDTVLNTGLKIAAISNQPMAIEEIGSEEARERETRRGSKDRRMVNGLPTSSGRKTGSLKVWRQRLRSFGPTLRMIGSRMEERRREGKAFHPEEKVAWRKSRE